jgi:hypothetical protein
MIRKRPYKYLPHAGDDTLRGARVYDALDTPRNSETLDQ